MLAHRQFASAGVPNPPAQNVRGIIYSFARGEPAVMILVGDHVMDRCIV